jgi:hypothetical protein
MVESRIITLDELRENKTKKSMYLLIHGKGMCLRNSVLQTSD